MSAIEIVRFTIAPADRAVLLAERPAAIMALSERFGGLGDASLAELEDGTWVDIVSWSTLAEAEDAAEAMPSIPAAARWAATITSVSEIVHGQVIVRAGGSITSSRGRGSVKPMRRISFSGCSVARSRARHGVSAFARRASRTSSRRR